MLGFVSKNVARRRVHLRIRSRLRGRPQAPRLNVFRSLKHIYAQIVDDSRGVTLAEASSRDDVKALLEGKGKVGTSAAVGKLLAQRAKEKGISAVAFDRGGYLYHGRVKALADGARAGGLNF